MTRAIFTLAIIASLTAVGGFAEGCIEQNNMEMHP